MGRRRIALLAVCVIVFAHAPWLPARAGVPATVEPMRKSILGREQYRRLRDEWMAYAESHPNDARAWVQLSKATGYCGEPCSASLGFAEKAHRLGPDDPDACIELAKHRWITWCAGAPAKPDEAIRLLEHALTADPNRDDARILLWVLRLGNGDRAGADAELRALLERGLIPEPLADFGYNELVALEPNAVLFTNGDNDTYPAVALQAARGFRTDVSVVNLSMLNLGWYRRMLREGPKPVPVPLLDQSPGGIGGAKEALHAILERAVKPGASRPVYLTVTVARDAYDVTGALSLEGAVYRVVPGPEKAVGADTTRLEHNLGSSYRLQSASSPAMDWNAWSAIDLLMQNYVAMDIQLAVGRWRAGNTVGMGRAFDRALRLCERHHWSITDKVIAMWRGWDPGSPELAAWTKRLGK